MSPATSKRFQDDEALINYLRIDHSADAWQTVYRFYREPIFIYFQTKGYTSESIKSILSNAFAEVLEDIQSKKLQQPLQATLLEVLLLHCQFLEGDTNNTKHVTPPAGYTYLAKKVLVNRLEQPNNDQVVKAIYDGFKGMAVKVIQMKFPLPEPDIEDVFQETMLALIARPPKDKEGQKAKLFTYFMTILHNKVIDLWNTKEKGDIPSGNLNDFEGLMDHLISETSHKNNDFWDYINEKHQLGEKFNAASDSELIEQLFTKISPDCRNLLKLRYIEGHKYKEIAKTINSPIDTIGQRIKRCLKKMKSEL